MYAGTAELYDGIYAFKDYPAEARRVRDLVIAAGGPGEGTLLDVACGTGLHAAALREHYRVEGLDAVPEMLEVARRHLPGVPLHHRDMREFDLGRTFDVITCLFSAIGYVVTEDGLRSAAAAMARHLRPGGALVIEPWFGPDQIEHGRTGLNVIDQPALKVGRVSRTTVEDGICVLTFDFVIATPDGVRHATERHELGLFTHEQMTAALEDCGLRVRYDEEGVSGRGAYVALRPA
jgi:SAM-dependent methyltransferase